MPKLRIEEAAARTQARIDSRRRRSIVGVNKYRLDDAGARRRARDRQHDGARPADRQPRASSAPSATTTAVRRPRSTALTRAAPAGDGNLLALAIDAARARATVGEISRRAGEGVRPPPGRDPYASPACTAPSLRAATRTVDAARGARSSEFAEAEGRRPRILVAKMGQDGHDRGAEGHRHRLRRPRLRRRHRPAVPDARGGRARQAVENDVHVVGVSQPGRRPQDPRAAAHRRRWRSAGAGDILVVVGGVIPPQDYDVAARRRASPPSSARAPIIAEAGRSTCSWCRAAARGCVSRAPTDVDLARRRRARRRPRGALARAITLVESTRADHRERGRELLDALAAASPAARVRVGISGRARRRQVDVHRGARPARSSATGHRVAVLAVDPSSSPHRRLDPRRQDPDGASLAPTRDAFIRPVARRRHPRRRRPRAPARRCCCCEAAGFDVVLVETVGVGQSEVAVAGHGRPVPAARARPAAATSCRASSAGSWSWPT